MAHWRKIRLIANEPGSIKGARTQAVTYISDQIAEHTGGEVSVERYWGGALFRTNAALGSIGQDVTDMGVIIGA